MENLRKIMLYLDGTMTREESHNFREKLEQDAELRKEVSFLQDINEAILDDETARFVDLLQNTVNRESTNKKKRLILKPLSMAAAAVLLLLCTTLLIQINRQDADTLFSKYYQPYEIHIATRSDEHPNSQLRRALWWYHQGNYGEAYQDLNDYIAAHPSDLPAHFYLGLCALEIDQTEMAIREFTRVTNDPSTPFFIHAQWYLSLSFIKTGDTDPAHDYLEKLSAGKNVYTKKARQLKRKI